SYLGLIGAFLLAVVAIGAGSYVAFSGREWAGAAIGGAMPVSGLLWALNRATSARNQEREAKAEHVKPQRRKS
ncbi:MAG: hypothetical protein K2V38_28140, partial [Gemmataceae bacterium]|nr:hypothetical protein [Gemmataceae bacterium]